LKKVLAYAALTNALLVAPLCAQTLNDLATAEFVGGTECYYGNAEVFGIADPQKKNVQIDWSEDRVFIDGRSVPTEVIYTDKNKPVLVFSAKHLMFVVINPGSGAYDDGSGSLQAMAELSYNIMAQGRDIRGLVLPHMGNGAVATVVFNNGVPDDSQILAQLECFTDQRTP